jgi:hypothetical protein
MLSKLTGLDFLKVASRCLSTLIPANIDRQQMDKELRGCSPACYEEIGKEKTALSHQISLLDFYKSYSGTPASYLYFWALETMFQRTHLQLKGKCQLISHLSDLIFFINFSSVYLHSRPTQLLWNHTAYLNIAFVGKSVSTNVTSLIITAHVNSGVDSNIICTSWSISLQPGYIYFSNLPQ